MAKRKRPTGTERESSESEVEEIAPLPATDKERMKGDKQRKQKFNKRFKVAEKTKEKVLEAQRAAWKSNIYKHFKDPEIIEVDAQALIRAHWDNSTSNLMRHIVKCEGKAAPAAGQATINEYAHGSSYTKPKMRLKLALTQSSSTSFECSTPRSRSLTRPQYLETCERYSTSLKRVLGKCFRNHCSSRFGRENAVFYSRFRQILAITADNASNNATLVAELDTRLGSANGVETRVRCLAHILNLVVKAIISVFTRKRKAAADDDSESEAESADKDEEALFLALETEGIEIDDPEEDLEAYKLDNDEYVLDADVEDSDKIEIDAIVEKLEAAHALEDDERRLACFAVTKLVELAKRVFHSPSIRADLKSCCVKAQVDDLQLAVIRALKIRGGVNKLLALPKYTAKGKKGLGRFKISDDEWTILEQLKDLLSAFLQATERVSQANMPLLPDTIPIIDVLTAHLTNTVVDKHKKGISSIQTEQLVREQWVMHYKPKQAGREAAATSESPSQDIFAAIDNWGLDSDVDAMDKWLSTPALPAMTKPLQWWNSQLDGGNGPPAHMALDFLSVPTLLTDVERAFSCGGLTVSKRRHSLNDESTRAATVISSWAAIPGVISEDDLLKLFANKSNRSKKTEVPNIVIDADADK
ncbi:hypothetical protein PHLGIDRAFT_14237 [Phlebiopsis gigantea 11061_1 CR5-6]|uniref:HAT C-terminal dimerisation domain-containing protein n=1 Tax=Phlebiopsis gigantea (strain 11061_1 CR5-6) TaxID=745531 RepID=A0A0C3S5Y6_PHLG1|nr:hypothetical protein PHLGIDRAFT_14237 [Phlebiopsis gigantea 11061_1 CR5-6]